MNLIMDLIMKQIINFDNGFNNDENLDCFNNNNNKSLMYGQNRAIHYQAFIIIIIIRKLKAERNV